MQAEIFLGARGVGVDVVESAHEESVAQRTGAHPAGDMGVQRGGAEDDEFGDGDGWVSESECG